MTNPPPLILHVIPTLASGGAERQLLTYLSNAQMRERFRHLIVLTDVSHYDIHDPLLHYADIAENLGIEIICLGRPGKFHLPGCIAALRRIIRERKVDLVHTQLFWSNVAGRIAARLCGIPAITSFQNTDYEPARIRSFGMDRSKARAMRWIDAVTSRFCLTHSVAVSESVSSHIQHYLGLKPETITVIFNTFSVEQVTPTSEDPRSKVFDIVGLAPGDRLVLAVGRVLDQKAHVDLVHAIADISRSRDDVHLVIVGSQVEQTYVAKVRETIEEREIGARVHLLEPRHDIPDFLAAADVFGFPSKYEGLPLALTEAMAAGVPCVVSDIGPNLELVQHEVNGLVIPVGDVQALTRAIVQILDDQHLAERLGGQAKIYVYENFHPDRKAESMVCLYEDVLSRKRK
ncbi:glycosyltransferase [bacterium]|nr:glycosyltransferase [bacterium]